MSESVVKLLGDDKSSIRDVFIRKMGAIEVTVAGKKYPAIATRDAILGKYKEVQDTTGLKSAVAFDGDQYSKVLKQMESMAVSSESVAKTKVFTSNTIFIVYFYWQLSLPKSRYTPPFGVFIRI